MNNICPKCNSDNWDWANIGFTDIVLCTNCGHLYPSTGDSVERVQRERERSDRCTHPADCWPFPTIDKPLKPLTPKEVKQYNKAKVQDLGDSPM